MSNYNLRSSSKKNNGPSELTIFCFKQHILDPSYIDDLKLISCLKIKSKCVTVQDVIESINGQIIGSSLKFPSSLRAYGMRLFDLNSKHKFHKLLKNNTPLNAQNQYAAIFYCTLSNLTKFLFIHPLSHTFVFDINDYKDSSIGLFSKSVLNLLPSHSNHKCFFKLLSDGFLCLYDTDVLTDVIQPNDLILPSLEMSLYNTKSHQNIVVVGPFYGNLEQFLASDDKSEILQHSPHYVDRSNRMIRRDPQASDCLLDVYLYNIIYS